MRDDWSAFEQRVGAAMRDQADATEHRIGDLQDFEVASGRRPRAVARPLVAGVAAIAVVGAAVTLYVATSSSERERADPGAAVNSSSSVASPTAVSPTVTHATTDSSSPRETVSPSPTLSATPPASPPPTKQILAILRPYAQSLKLSIGPASAIGATLNAAATKYLGVQSISGGRDASVWVVAAPTVDDGTAPNVDEAERHISTLVIILDADSLRMIGNKESIASVALDGRGGTVYELD